MDLTLEQLLASLSNGLDKSASDKEDDKEDKDEKEDDKPAFLKKKEDKSEKDDDESDDEESDGQTKEASAQGAALAREIMEKVAGLNLESVTGMQKTASSAGKTLAQALIQKLASAGDMITADGVYEGAVPNKNQVDNAQMHAEGASYIKPMPTSDGLRPTGSINEIFDAIVADAMSQGAASTDQVHETGVSQHEGEVEDHALPNQVKAAAMNELLEQGFDFDQAADMVKEAGRADAAKAAVGKAKGAAKAAAGKAYGAAKAKGTKGLEVAKGGAKAFSDHVRANPYKTVAQAGLLGAGVELTRRGLSEKKASAMSELLESGIDFDQAADMVKQASAELEDQFEKAAAVDHLVDNGVDFDDAVELVKQASLELEDQFEKAAAVDYLVDNGVDFEDAIELVKQAAEDIAEEDFGMAKAAALGELLGEGFDFDDALEMIKQASAGDMITDDGVYEGAVPNKNQVDNAQMHAEGASYIKPMLTSDGLRPTGTINEIFDAVIQDAISQGAASTDQVHETGVSQHEGEVEDHAVPNQVKTAAMNELLEAGFDFDQAVDMVKEAGRADAAKAAVGKAYGAAKAKGAAGVDAAKGAAGKIKAKAGQSASNVKGAAGNLAYDARVLGARADTKTRELGRGAKAVGSKAVDYTKANPYKVGAGAVGALAAGGAGAYAMSEKKAEAMSLLLEQGVDFDQAAEMVKQASDKLGV